MYIYLNGEIVKKEEAIISPFDHGFLYGIGLFETFRTYDGHPFLLDDHLERLNQGLSILNIQAEFEREQVLSMLQTLNAKNNHTHAYIRFNVSAGNGEIGLQVSPYSEPTVIIYSKPLLESKGLQEKSIKLLELRRNSPEGKTRLKSHHYLNNVLGKMEIGNNFNEEGIFLTNEGFLAEGIVSNLFWIRDRTIYTPAIETGILNGVTRMFIITLGKKLGFSIREGFFYPEEIQRADEVFLTNSIQEIVAVSNVEGNKKPGNQGEKVRLLQKHYKDYIDSLWTRKELSMED